MHLCRKLREQAAVAAAAAGPGGGSAAAAEVLAGMRQRQRPADFVELQQRLARIVAAEEEAASS